MDETQKVDRRSLFQKHLVDLNRLFPDVEDMFICPICLKVLCEKDVLSIGHVWPQKFSNLRDKKVLVCKCCNSNAGSRGDAAMQEFEEARPYHGSDQIFRPCNEVASSETFVPDTKLIPLGTMPVEVDSKSLKARIQLRGGKRRNYNPKAMELMKSGLFTMISTETLSVEDKWKLARVGWLTSAYLSMFNRFGYGYILHSCLDGVRACIMNSFDKQPDDTLEFHDSSTMCVWSCTYCNEQEPKMEIVLIPDTDKTPQHIKVTLNDYHIRLPVLLDLPPISNEVRQECERNNSWCSIDCYDPKLDDPLAQCRNFRLPNYGINKRTLYKLADS